MTNQETNLEHYIIKNLMSITKKPDTEIEIWEFRFKEGTERQFRNADCKSIYDWLLLPYEPQKLKLTQFEYDLLKCYRYVSERGIVDDWVLELMHKEGYFKDVPTDIPIRDILNNCEIVEL